MFELRTGRAIGGYCEREGRDKLCGDRPAQPEPAGTKTGAHMRRYLLVLASLVVCPALHAQTLAAVVNREASTSAVDFDSTLKTSGTLVGDFDAVSNPLGTQTRLGFAGGSGNMPIPTTVDVLSTSGGSAAPDGVFGLGLDLPALSGSLHGLALELASGSTFPANASARLTYETFRTISPNCFFLAIGAVTLPLGEVGQVRDIVLVQTDTAAVQFVPTPDPQRFDFEAVVPALLSLVVDMTLGGEPRSMPLADLPVLLPVSGTLQRTGNDRFEMRAVLAPQTFDGLLDLAGEPLPPTALSLPCVSQPANPNPNLVLHLLANALEFELQLGFELVAEAFEQAPDLIFVDGFEG
jgi:hypothetical protein